MDLYTVSLKNYKRIYQAILLINAAAIIGSYLLVRNNFIIIPFLRSGNRFTNPVIVIMIATGYLHMTYNKKLLKKLDTFQDFDEKVIYHEKTYKLRLVWHLVTSLISCFIFVLTARNLFLIFAIIDYAVMLLYFPNKFVFRKELKNEEIDFV